MVTNTDSGPKAAKLLHTATDCYLRGDYAGSVTRCQAALRLLNSDTENDLLRIRIIWLLTMATEPWWSAHPSAGQQIPLEDIMGLVAQIRERQSDPVIFALASHVRGRYLLLTDNLVRAIEAFAEAVSHARRGDDRLVEFAALIDFGHVQIGRDFDTGLANLRRALRLAEHLSDSGSDPMLSALIGRLFGFIGVAEFDAGQFDSAERWLRQSFDKFSGLGVRDQLATMENYLGQLLIAVGRFEESEELLAHSAEVLTDFAVASTHRAYNLGLLGKLYLEWGRPDDAFAPLQDAWRQIQETDHKAIIPLLRNYSAELLLHPNHSGRDTMAAEALLSQTIEECRQTGFVRSEVAALSLLALSTKARGDLDTAYELSSIAVAMLEEAGTMPALRTEEIYFAHALILRSRTALSEAQRWLTRASNVLHGKASTIADARRRHLFLQRVPVSRAIVAATS